MKCAFDLISKAPKWFCPSMLPVAVLAGGLATRLRPLTETLPKALLPIAGEPFIFHQLSLLKRQQVEQVVLCIGHFGEQIRTSIGDGGRFGLKVRYSLDGERPLGTGGALKRALPLLGSHFFVLNGDSYLRCSYDEIESAYVACERLGLMTVFRNDNQWDSSNVSVQDGEIVEYSKSASRNDLRHIDFGLSVLASSVLADYPANAAFDLSAVYQDLTTRRQLSAFEMPERFYEVGSLAGIRDTEAMLSRRPTTA
jgi:MurNAc alpha-1-phosphate uridylyltransferase